MRARPDSPRTRRSFRWSILALALCGLAPGVAAGVIHVRPGGNDASSGADWASAKATVMGAIAAAQSLDEIWVATGFYYEHVHNRLVGGQAVDVALYGGFAGWETSREQRDWNANPTVLHGSNSGTVVAITGAAGRQTRIDGFYITGGNSSGGGGVSILASAPVIANNTIRLNLTTGAGAGILCYGFEPLSNLHPLITHNVISENFSHDVEGDGGGIGCIGSSPEISHNLIAGNRASENGGGIVCWAAGDEGLPLSSSPLVANNWIVGNSANILDGGSDQNYGGGAIFASATDVTGQPIGATSEPVIVNNVIAANGAWKGGGLALVNSTAGAATVVNNTIVANSGAGALWENTAPTLANNLVAYNSIGLSIVPVGNTAATLEANNVWGNELHHHDADYVLVDDATGTAGNISQDPLLANHAMRDFHLQPGSPCIDAGSAAHVVAPWPDLDQQSRVLGGGVDIGADESDGTSWTVSGARFHVKPGGSDAADGKSWAAAKATVAAAIAAARQEPGEVWVAQGTYAEHVVVPAYVYLYGGFAGGETERAQRDVAGHPTILDGSGTPTVVTSENAGYRASAIDGFTIQHGGHWCGGNLWDIVSTTARGAGVSSLVGGPLIANNTIRYNSLGTPFTTPLPIPAGGGIGGYLSTAVIQNNTITENEVLTLSGEGGGLWFKLSYPLIEGNWIHHNHARYGSALFAIVSAPRATGNVFEANNMYVWSGLLHGSATGALDLTLCPDYLVDSNVLRGHVSPLGGAASLHSNWAGRVENNLFEANTAWDYSGYGDGGIGGALWMLVPATPNDDQAIVNNTFAGNSATNSFDGERGAIALDLLSDRLVVANNVLAHNSSGLYQNTGAGSILPVLQANLLYNAGVNYRNLQAGPTDSIFDPDFRDVAGHDWRLAAGSRCVDLGDGGLLQNGAQDLAGAPRVVDGDYDGTAAVDLGAYEWQPDRDGDGILDAADPDDDADGVVDAADNCPLEANPEQFDADADGAGDACDVDVDGDGAPEHPGPPAARLPYTARDVTAASSTLPAQPAAAYLYVAGFDGTTNGLGWWNATAGSWIDGAVAPYRKPLAIYVDTNDCGCIDLREGDTLSLSTDRGGLTIHLPDQPAGWAGWLFVAADGATYFDAGLTALACSVPAPPGDNCPVWNPTQSDFDLDGQGDRCDLDDGLIHSLWSAAQILDWQAEAGHDAWNVYLGDLDVLRQTGVYTQAPGSNPLAWRACGLTAAWYADATAPPAGQVRFYLISGVSAGVEGSLGRDSAGVERVNSNPCP